MSPAVARDLKRYAEKALPEKVRRKNSGMVALLQQKLKRWWFTELSHKERGAFRRIARAGRPLPERFKQLARGCNIVVEWPPPPRKPPKRRRLSKPNSYWAKHYRRRR